ncbi:hypothetical protein Acr_20g0008360 [Actinidia rufa]|uniref:Uncharacterized protein n=1 Tax=Actinidia rufa TaxID=165716 RepID=A0A7J0GE87_9ERIC|nr:hypothetical protein Acr_20g0008360 [Actinidia rufa]
MESLEMGILSTLPRPRARRRQHFNSDQLMSILMVALASSMEMTWRGSMDSFYLGQEGSEIKFGVLNAEMGLRRMDKLELPPPPPPQSAIACDISTASIFFASSGRAESRGRELEDDEGGGDLEILGGGGRGRETTALWPLVDEAREKSMELGLPTKAEKRAALREGAENTVGGDVAGSDGLEGGGGDSSSF